MGRVEIQRISADKFLKEIKTQTGFSYIELSRICNVHRRSFSDWANGKTLMPIHVFQKLVQISGLQPPFKVLPDHWHVKEAGKKGGIKRNQLFGNPGTFEGRKLGGKNSYNKFLANPDFSKRVGFVLEKNINYPVLSPSLAELVGIILGDGGISPYQLNITLNKSDDFDYSRYVSRLIKTVFGVQPAIYERDSVINIVVSRVKLIKYLLKQELSIGSKVRQQVKVPEWVETSYDFIKACIRGLLDTDGCFYVDQHRYNGKLYLNPALNFTNRSVPLLQFFKRNLEKFGFHPTQKTKYSIFLRREDEIIRYFKEIGSSNSKHTTKFQSYLKIKYGEVPKWS